MAIKIATHTMMGTATGLTAMCPMPDSFGSETRESATSIDPIAATAATRLMVVTAPIFPSRMRLRGAGVSSRLSSVLRSRALATGVVVLVDLAWLEGHADVHLAHGRRGRIGHRHQLQARDTQQLAQPGRDVARVADRVLRGGGRGGDLRDDAEHDRCRERCQADRNQRAAVAQDLDDLFPIDDPGCPHFSPTSSKKASSSSRPVPRTSAVDPLATTWP